MKVKFDIDTVIDEAFAAAEIASLEKEKTITEWYPCGFAWVDIKPAHSKFAKRMLERGLAKRGYEVGISVWNPSRHYTQNMYIKYAGAIAFADVLKGYGIKAVADCRMD